MTRSARSRTLRAHRLTRIEVERGKLIALPVGAVERPRFRGDCSDGPRPCPWVSCKHHLFLDVDPETGSLKLNFPDVSPDELGRLPATCALDMAERGGLPLEAVGELMNLTRERVRQLEASGLEWAARALDEPDAAAWLPEENR